PVWPTPSFPDFPRAVPCYLMQWYPDLRAARAARASRRNVYPRHHQQRTENCVEHDAHAVRSPGHSVSPSSSGSIFFIRDIWKEGRRSYVIYVTFLRIWVRFTMSLRKVRAKIDGQ